MSFTAITLSELPKPQFIAQPGFEALLSEYEAEFLQIVDAHGDPEYSAQVRATLALESEPLKIDLEQAAYRETVWRQALQELGLQTTLAFATGDALDRKGDFYGIMRAVVQEADPTTNPPSPQILEDDIRLRRRIQEAPEGFATTGTLGNYIVWGMAASPLVKGIQAVSPAPGEVEVYVLSTEGTGVPSAELLATVNAELYPRRPLCTNGSIPVIVKPAEIVPFEVQATLTLYEGPSAELVREAAEERLRKHITERHQLGHDITVAGLHGALFVEGVQNISLGAFTADLVIGPHQAAYCDPETISVQIGGRDV